MSAKTVSENLQHLINKMEDFISTKTVVGEPMHHGDITVIPLMDVSLGMGTGLASGNASPKSRDGGGGAFGAKMTPVAMLVINGTDVRILNVNPQESTSGSKIIDMIPGILSKLNLGSWFDKKKDSTEPVGWTTTSEQPTKTEE